MEKFDLPKGEKKFLEKFEKIHQEYPYLQEAHPEKGVKLTLEKIKEEIQNLPETKTEVSFHPHFNFQQSTNILSQAIQIAIEEDVAKALDFIYKTKNPYLIDAFHDLLVAHFLSLIQKEK